MNDLNLNILKNICTDNLYLIKYVDLISENESKVPTASITENHHIIPRCYFKHYNLIVDDSKDNLVTLSLIDHILAHYYLALCAKEGWFKYANIICLNWLTHRTLDELSENWIIEHSEELIKLREDGRQLNSQLQKGLYVGEKNGNAKYTLEQCLQVQTLLLQDMSYEEIKQITGVSDLVIRTIRKGRHWSCSLEFNKKYENFLIEKKERLKLEREKNRKAKTILDFPKYKKQYLEWIKEEHFCLNCQKKITEFITSKIGNGIFCSRHCSYSWQKKQYLESHPEVKKKFAKNRRSYVGENNPNFGKRASEELRLKMSISQKEAAKHSKSTRFKGHTHTEEEKRKISESLKKTNALKKLKKENS